MMTFRWRHALIGLVLISLGILIFYYAGLERFKVFLGMSVDTAIDVNVRDRFGNTPLMNAVVANDYDRVKTLLEDPTVDIGAISYNSDKDTILTIACVNAANAREIRALDVIRLLIDAGADVNKGNAVGLSPLHAAMRIWPLGVWIDVLRTLVEAGAHINAQAVDGATVMHIAVSMNLPDIIRILNKEFAQIINYDKKQVFNLDRNMKGEYTPLELARRLGKVGVDSAEEALLMKPATLGADGNLDATDAGGRTPLMLALWRGDTAMANSLIEQLGKKNKPIHGVSPDGKTTLMYAVIGDDPVGLVPAVLKDDAVKKSINAKDKAGNSALLLLACVARPSDRITVGNMLLEAGASLKDTDKNGRTLVERARRLGDGSLMTWAQNHS